MVVVGFLGCQAGVFGVVIVRFTGCQAGLLRVVMAGFIGCQAGGFQVLELFIHCQSGVNRWVVLCQLGSHPARPAHTRALL